MNSQDFLNLANLALDQIKPGDDDQSINWYKLSCELMVLAECMPLTLLLATRMYLEQNVPDNEVACQHRRGILDATAKLLYDVKVAGTLEPIEDEEYSEKVYDPEADPDDYYTYA